MFYADITVGNSPWAAFTQGYAGGNRHTADEVMVCRMDSIVESPTNLKTLTEGIHSKEALELVREHVLGVMGPASMAYSNTMIKMAKLQVRQLLL